jgi:hypothetical protein
VISPMTRLLLEVFAGLSVIAMLSPLAALRSAQAASQLAEDQQDGSVLYDVAYTEGQQPTSVWTAS